MTCIAVKVEKDKIEIACDTQATWGRDKLPIHDKTDKQTKASGKLYEVNNMVLGCAGSLSNIMLLRRYSKTHKPKDTTLDDVQDWFVEFIEWADKKFNEKNFSIHGLLVFEKRVYQFFDFLDVNEIKDFNAVGSGMFLAIGAMENGADVIDAVQTAIKYDLYCGGEVKKITIKK